MTTKPCQKCKPLIAFNPWYKWDSPKARAPKAKVAYTITETVAILNAIERTDAKLVFALASVLGLRPSEIAGLKFEDVEGDQLHVRRAAPYGVVGETKTPESQQSLELIEPVKTLLATWRKECGGVDTGWLFTRPNGEPINHNEFVRKHISPRAKEVCPRWCGIYSGRRGCGTTIAEIAPEQHIATAAVLRNSVDTSVKHYIKANNSVAVAASKLFEQAISEEMDKKVPH